MTGPDRPTKRPARTKPGKSFQQRYDDTERRRDQLLTKLSGLGEAVARHPGYRRARLLLNDTFRHTTLAKRTAVLEAASWLIDVLEKLAPTL